MHLETETLLGQTTTYSDTFDKTLLTPIPRSLGRASLPLEAPCGEDVWRLYELTWLAPNGLPIVMMGVLRVPASSPFIVESKSLKLYLGGFTQTVFESPDAVIRQIEADLNACLKTQVRLELFPVDCAITLDVLQGTNLEASVGQEGSFTHYEVTPSLLKGTGQQGAFTVNSNLLRSRCPVTGQPDHASVEIEYEGDEIEPTSLLAYIVSFRRHQGFHEQCVEMIYAHLMSQFKLDRLTVKGCFTRRGGIDISPVRSSHPHEGTPPRTPRQ